MKRRFTAICTFLLLAIPVGARSQSTNDKQSSQDKKDQDKTVPDKAQIVGTAEITKIDAKKQVLQVKNVEPASNTSPTGNNGGNGGRRTGGGGGGVGFPGGGGGGVGFPGGGGRRRGGYPGGGYPGGGGGNRTGTQSGQPKEYKVYVTKDTAIKLANADLAFTDLHVGDRIQVLGTAKSGSSGDLQATAITRDPQ